MLIAKNDAPHIEGIIRWLLGQNYYDALGVPRYEIVVVDDDSQDDTAAILERLGRRYNFPVVKTTPGQSAYELGLELCQGEVVCLLNLKKKLMGVPVGQLVTGLFGG